MTGSTSELSASPSHFGWSSVGENEKMANPEQEDWYDDESASEDVEYPLHEYELTSSPNDFNILTLFNFIESGTVRVPGFQRNFVWDIRRASKLIESMVTGLPVPQIFLYEEGRNKFLVIDG